MVQWNSILNDTKEGASAAGFIDVAAYLKVVWRRKPSSAEVREGGQHERGDYSPLVRGFGGLPRENL